VRWLFLVAYTCSGLAGLIYQVCWTRLLTLSIGHTTAAASAVVAAFLGGLALGAARGGALAARLPRRHALAWYAGLELGVAGLALLFPLEVKAFTPLLAWAYQDGASTAVFASIRLLACLAMVFVPATALGATFPLAVRWFAAESDNRALSSGILYALNSAGAAVGAVLAGFLLIPRIGVSGTTLVGVGASLVASVSVATVLLLSDRKPKSVVTSRAPRGSARRWTRAVARVGEPRWLGGTVLGLSGFAALVHEIAWTRVLTMVLGPTIYAFSAALAAVILGIALGSSVGTAIVARSRKPALWLAVSLSIAAATGTWTSSLAGGPIPRVVAEQIAATPELFDVLQWRGALLTAMLIVPMAGLLGAAFPLALAMIDDPSRSAEREFASVYAINTFGSVVGALAAGFVLIPLLGLEATLKAVTVCLIVASAIVLGLTTMPRSARVSGALVSAIAAVLMFVSAPWDRELLASGAYMYAPFAPKGANLEALLKAGTLMYYREGAAATISVKRLTGTLTLAVDGKTDASNRGDMLTQKLVAHLPLLLHAQPREVAVIGLGSGVTVGAALRHPIDRVDVVEISPEVVEASTLFAAENRAALADPRTALLVADGRSHLQLSHRKYDVIISEPSNPWIAGVAALFTREFFTLARARLAPGGLICQWANAYNISDRDLRAIVATFLSVFPHGTAWLVGADDVVLLASDGPLDDRLQNIAAHWRRPGVSEDLATVAAAEPFSLWSLFVAGPEELRQYAEQSEVLTDDRMTVEFSGPREVRGRTIGQNGAQLRALLGLDRGPAAIREARAAAGSDQWQRRGDMMAARDAYTSAYEDYFHALTLDASNKDALDGFVRTALLTRRAPDSLDRLKSLRVEKQFSARMLVATSKLLESAGSRAEAIGAATEATHAPEVSAEGLEQLASLHADAGDRVQLDAVLARMRTVMADRPATAYYEGVAAFLRGDAAETQRLAERAVALDASYAAAYDLLGAAHSKRGDVARARQAFLDSLRFDAHDSTAYANLGVLALNEGQGAIAADYFAEALWLDADSELARAGLAQAIERR
jgi:spermidine synthase